MADAGDTALRDPSDNGKYEYPYPPELPGETLVETGPRKTEYPADWNIYFARLGSSFVRNTKMSSNLTSATNGHIALVLQSRQWNAAP